MKKTVSLILALMLVLSLAACGGKTAAEPDFTALTARVAEAVPTIGDMVARDADYIKNMVGVDSALYTDALVMSTNVGTSRDEYGVFKCADAKAAETVKTACETYLQQCVDTMMGYTPEELPKLEGAKVTAQGSYVVYTVLASEVQTAALKAFGDCFTEG